ncbi:hypothetical protein BC827DRAFT_416669 [Russula dissimulans]|nr:hypothetical protein BC827DRAFT_416669 [Russula dissimulans]
MLSLLSTVSRPPICPPGMLTCAHACPHLHSQRSHAHPPAAVRQRVHPKLPTWPLVYHTYTVWISTIFSWYPHRSLRKRRGRGQSCSHRVYTRLTHTILAFSRGVSPHESLPPRLVKSQLIHLAFQCKVVSRRSRWLSGDSPRRGHRELKPEV